MHLLFLVYSVEEPEPSFVEFSSLLMPKLRWAGTLMPYVKTGVMTDERSIFLLFLIELLMLPEVNSEIDHQTQTVD